MEKVNRTTKGRVRRRMCSTCGSVLEHVTYVLSYQLVEGLFRLASKASVEGKASLSDGEVAELIPPLKAFGMVREVNEFGHHAWFVTELGKDFLLGKVRTPKAVTVFRGEVVTRSEEDVDVYGLFPNERQFRLSEDEILKLSSRCLWESC